MLAMVWMRFQKCEKEMSSPSFTPICCRISPKPASEIDVCEETQHGNIFALHYIQDMGFVVKSTIHQQNHKSKTKQTKKKTFNLVKGNLQLIIKSILCLRNDLGNILTYGLLACICIYPDNCLSRLHALLG